MNPDPNFQQAIHAEITWKNAEVQAFAVSLIKHALETTDNFTTDIVPDSERVGIDNQPLGTGIAGTVIEILKNGGLIESVGVSAHGVFYQHRIKSERPGRKAAYLNVYKLKSRSLAQEFLRRNGKMTVQAELNLAPA